MPADAPTTTETTTTTDAPPQSTRDRAFAAMDAMGDAWGDLGDDDSEQPSGEQLEATSGSSSSPKPETTEPDPLAELAKKVEERLRAKAQPEPKTSAQAWDRAAYERNPIGYLESLGLDVVEHADVLFKYANLSKEERATAAERAELERYRQAEEQRKQQEQAAREAQEATALEDAFLEHVKAVDDRTGAPKYPNLAALARPDLLRYTYEVAQLVVDAGEDADTPRLADLTERRVAQLAKKLPAAGAGGQPKQAVVGDRDEQAADGGGPTTITNQLTAESGSPAERDLSPEGRRKAALRAMANLGW